MLLMKKDVLSDRKNSRTGGLGSSYMNPVWIQCKGYRCLAYLDLKGKWINLYTGKKLTDFVKVLG